MSRTDIEKRNQQSELAQAVASWRKEGENELETATRVLAEIAGLKKLDARQPKAKGLPETDVAAPFDEPVWFDNIREDETLRKLLPKGDRNKVLVGPVSVELETNGTVTVAAVSLRKSKRVGTGVSKRSPHDNRNDATGMRQAVVRGIRDLVIKELRAQRRKYRKKSA